MRETTLSSSIDTTFNRDLTNVGLGLASWLARRWPGASCTALELPQGAGSSSELFFTDILGSPYTDAGVILPVVLRLASTSDAVYPVVDLLAQSACMNAAESYSAAPVPGVYAVETDGDILGAPFLLMRRLPGQRAPDMPSYVLEGWLLDLSTPDRRSVWCNSIAAIARLHDTDLDAAGIRTHRLPCYGQTSLHRMLAYWELFLRHVEAGGEQRVLSQAVAWLHANAPDMADDEGLVWGDASLRNMLFDKLQPVALIDFEFAHVGLRVFDIAFFSLMDYVVATGFAGRSHRLEGFLGIQESLDYYESLTGRAVRHREYLLRMALTYMSLATTRVYQRLAQRGHVAPDEVLHNPPLQLLAEVCAGAHLPD